MDAGLTHKVIMQRGKVDLWKTFATEFPGKFKYVCAADMAKEDGEQSVLGKFGGTGMDLMIVDDDLMRITVDPVPPSRHRSRRILKKLRKRLGEPYKQDFALFMTEQIRKAFYIEPKFLMPEPTETEAHLMRHKFCWEMFMGGKITL